LTNRIKELRAKNNLSQLDLGQRVGVRRETIIFLEKGKYNPSLKLAYDISRVFQLAIEEVFIFKDDQSPVDSQMSPLD
jgi:putative transcriptional regulator